MNIVKHCQALSSILNVSHAVLDVLEILVLLLAGIIDAVP